MTTSPHCSQVTGSLIFMMILLSVLHAVEHVIQIVQTDDGYAERFGFVELASAVLAGEQIVGFLADRTGDLASSMLNIFLASSRLMSSNVPVMTKVRPAKGCARSSGPAWLLLNIFTSALASF